MPSTRTKTQLIVVYGNYHHYPWYRRTGARNICWAEQGFSFTQTGRLVIVGEKLALGTNDQSLLEALSKQIAVAWLPVLTRGAIRRKLRSNIDKTHKSRVA